MVSKMITLRVDEGLKRRIETAAQSRGQNLTTFMLNAAQAEAKRVESRPPSKGQHTGVPTFFRAACYEAARGGSNGYLQAGYTLARHVATEQPYDTEQYEWFEEVDRLIALLNDGDEDDVWEWFVGHYPKAMQLVPRRRREQFVAGVIEAYDDGKVEP